MNKETLEEYILEARALREQVEILTRLITLLMEEPVTFDWQDLEEAEATAVKIENGTIYVG